MTRSSAIADKLRNAKCQIWSGSGWRSYIRNIDCSTPPLPWIITI